MTTHEIIKWTCSRENSGNCDECPYNEGFSEWPGNRLPCGQFHCWVDLHCEDEECDTMELAKAIEEKEESTMRTWYAAVMDREDNDWGYGSHDLEEAKKMARKLGKESLIIVIDDGNDPVAVGEINPWEEQ